MSLNLSINKMDRAVWVKIGKRKKKINEETVSVKLSVTFKVCCVEEDVGLHLLYVHFSTLIGLGK